jgi:hypothetical protein
LYTFAVLSLTVYKILVEDPKHKSDVSGISISYVSTGVSIGKLSSFRLLQAYKNSSNHNDKTILCFEAKPQLLA